MGVLFGGLIHVTGEPDTGKTMFAFSCGAQPEDIIFVDDDVKGKATVDMITAQKRKLGMYFDFLTGGAGKKEVDLHKYGISLIEQMEAEVKKRGKPFECLIWDTWTRFENTFHPWVATYPNLFKNMWSPNGLFKGAEQWKVSFEYEAQIMARLLNVARLVIITTHLKPHTVAGKKTGKYVPDCKKPVEQKTFLRVYLRHSATSPAPVGLVLKRISKPVMTDSGIRIVSVLPRRIEPFTWDKIREYWDNPIDQRQPTEFERPNAWELSILDDTLTEDQKEIMRMQPDVDPDATVEEPQITDEVVANVKALKEAGKPIPLIAKETGMEIATVTKALSM